MLKLRAVLRPVSKISGGCSYKINNTMVGISVSSLRHKSDDMGNTKYRQESSWENTRESIQDKINREHSIDESELFSDTINSKVYYAKRENSGPQSNESVKEILRQRQLEWDNAELAQTKGIKILSEQEQMDRIEKMTRINSLLQGLAVLIVALGGAYFLTNDRSIKELFSFSGKNSIDVEKIDEQINTNLLKSEKKSKKRSSDLKSEFAKLQTAVVGMDSDKVVQWENGKTHEFTVSPKSSSLLKNKKKVLDLVESGDSLYYITSKGDLYKLNIGKSSTNKEDELLLKDQKIVKLAATGSNEIFAQTQGGELLIIPLQQKDDYKNYISSKRSKLFPWKHYDVYEKKFPMLFKQFDVGVNHFVGVGLEDGLVYTCAIGCKDPMEIDHRGQFGLPRYAPVKVKESLNLQKELQPYSLQNIELLNYFVKNDKLQERHFVNVSCGKYHTVAIDRDNEIYTFGNNTFGQLGVAVTYDTENIAYPKKLRQFPQLNRESTSAWKCEGIQCGDYTTYFKVLDEYTSKYTYFSFGNGLVGQLGNVHFKNTQQSPTKMKYDHNDSIKQWSFQDTQCSLVNSENKLYVWGFNSKNNIPGILPNKKFAYPIDTNLELKDSNKVLITKNNGTIIY